jgi:eukaryotic-like serine/threonine-protein kinase
MHPAVGPDVGIREGDLIAGKYRVDRILGVGGMGVVVAAHHLRLEELVAIKLLLPEALTDADAVRRFDREARAAVKIKSEHVTRILDVGALDSGAPFIVMEYLEGEDLAERIARTGPLSVEAAIELLLQACEAIAEAHTLGIVHRDLKPANLFCIQGAEGRPFIKVLDFGISKITRSTVAGSGLGMTKTAAVIGSPFYMSPEQMESPRSVDARTDIWSLGIVLYQLLTAEVPFNGETLPQVCVNVATRPAPSLRRSRPDVPTGLETVLLRCLEKEPSKRFSTVAALAAALARFGSHRAQVSLDRIARTLGQAEAGSDDGDGPRQNQTTDRPVTGPLPSWGATAKSTRPRARSIIGWTISALLVIAIGLTFVRRPAPTSSLPAPAVLIGPPSNTETATIAKELPRLDPVAPAPPGVPVVPEARAPSTGVTPIAKPPPAGTPANLPPPAPPTTRPAPETATTRPGPETESNPYISAPELPKPAAAASMCALNLNATPAAVVVLDGKTIGHTPKIGIAIAAGEHRVSFRWNDGEKHESFSCGRGETKTIALRQYDSTPHDEPFIKNPYR